MLKVANYSSRVPYFIEEQRKKLKRLVLRHPTTKSILVYLLKYFLVYLLNTFVAYLLFLLFIDRSNLFDARYHSLILTFLFLNTVLSAGLIAIKLTKKLLSAVDVGVNLLLGLGRANWSLREQLESSMSQVKYFKMQRRFDEALKTINEIIEKDPEYPEALFLKARILWEGFGNSGAAKAHLKKVIKIVPNENEPLHQWASGLYDKLTKIENTKEKPSIGNPGMADTAAKE